MNESKRITGTCYTCSNYEEQTRHCALLDIWFERTFENVEHPAEIEGDCEYYTTDTTNN